MNSHPSTQTGKVSFKTEGRLLQELGERLVASPEVALVELVKNAFDADATRCDVNIDKHNNLVVSDDGIGMTLEQFARQWMTIATGNKQREQFSSIFKRKRTGQKGIGRFAVRYLGSHLTLSTRAIDPRTGRVKRLEADFNWIQIDNALEIGSIEIPYRLFEEPVGTSSGTTLTISKLRHSTGFVIDKGFTSKILRMVNPLNGLSRGRFGERKYNEANDPGFKVHLPSIDPADNTSLDLTQELIDKCWAKLTIDLSSDRLKYRIQFKGEENEVKLDLRIKNSISNGFYADIRFFPRRKGIFSDTSVNGNTAWQWVRENTGIAVIDHGFRLRPYGMSAEDDWLSLDADNAHRKRDWRSDISEKKFPIDPMIAQDPALNPALNLPTNFQLVGAVFIESTQDDKQIEDLTPAMDREGLLKNQAFKDLNNIVRAGIEFLANADKALLQRIKEEEARKNAKRIREDFRSAIQFIDESPTLTKADKVRLAEHYTGLAKKVEEIEDYDKEARRNLETMSLLGAVAAFMTHEAAAVFENIEKAIALLKKVETKDRNLKSVVEAVETHFESLRGQIDYTRTFIEAIHAKPSAPFKSAPQVKRIIRTFKQFADERKITVTSEIDQSIEAPGVALPIYSGILLNLYSNAIKAILSVKNSQRLEHQIVFRSWNEPKWHIVEVLDTGTGVPPALRKRIFDPLFTTTSRQNNPLGTGMGLGLSLVQSLLKQIGGKVELVDSPGDFSTCMKVYFPRNPQ